MASEITIAVEGQRADVVLGEFLVIPGVQGHARPVPSSRPVRDGGATLLAIGAVVGIASGIASIVDKIIEWREKWAKADETMRLNVVIEDARGNRLSLDRATREQISAALKSLSQ